MNVDYDIAQWIKLSDTELASAKHLFKTFKPMPCEIICNLSQQAAEKIIKGFLFSRNIEAPKIHDLRELCDMCLEIEPGFNTFDRETSVLSNYGVFPRYPNNLQLEEHDAEQAIKYAEKIVGFVRPFLIEASKREE
ncbi:MAG: HEPN domain-containing protein [Oscillospiraceae bacterium]|nr:HEPN domain-containing protein [Oscillospiraceae bacterium]